MGKKLNWVTMLTPYTSTGDVDYDGIDKIVEWYIENKVTAIFAVCQSSEIFYLTLDERIKIGERVVKAVNGRVPVAVSGHISDNIEDQITELRAMSKVGADAVAMISNRLAKAGESDDVWIANAQKILDAIPDVEFGVYECPYPYKRLMSDKVIKWCIESGRFSFTKDTCCDLETLKRRIDLTRGTKFKIFNANTTTLLESLRYGGDGFCGIMLNFHPELYYYISEHYAELDNPKLELYNNFATVASLIEYQLYPINAKYNMQINGVDISLHSRSKPNLVLPENYREEVRDMDTLWKTIKAMTEEV